jgi:hypothetical protein
VNSPRVVISDGNPASDGSVATTIPLSGPRNMNGTIARVVLRGQTAWAEAWGESGWRPCTLSIEEVLRAPRPARFPDRAGSVNPSNR